MSTTFTNTGNFTGNLTGTGTNSANTNTGMATGTGTGSWANSTHSVIWMSRSGKSPAMPNTNQPHAAQYASLTVAALLTIAAASNLIDVYGSALSWTSAAIPATIIGSLVALAGLVPALRLWWQMLFMACAQLVVGPVIFLNGTTIAHVIPTLRTLTQGWMRMLGSFKYLLAHRPADRHRRRLAARRVDDLPVGRAAGRYLRGCGGWPAYDGRGRSRRGESCDLRAAWHVERLLPYGDRHDYDGRAGGLGQRALETVGIGPLAQFRSHRAAGFGCGDRRMLGGRAKPHHSARPL